MITWHLYYVLKEKAYFFNLKTDRTVCQFIGGNQMNVKQELVREPESTAVIRFQDCDPFGHLNNARYIDYFMNARMDQIADHYGLQLLQEGGSKSWVVTKSQIAYFVPANLLESVRIRTRLIHAAERSLVVEGLMLDEKASHLKAVLWMEFTYFDLKTGRSSRHPEELMQLLRSLEVDGFGQSFEVRSDSLRGQYRNNGRQKETTSQQPVAALES
jgi:acyl-CoA thioester hydrolase